MPGTGKRRPQRTLFLMMAVALFVSLSIVVVSFIMNQSASWHKDHTQLGAMVPCVANNTRYLCIPRGSAPVRGEPVPRRDGTAQQQQHAREHAREHARAAHDAVSVNNAHNRGRAHVHDDSVHPADADSEATAASTQAAGTNAFVEGTASKDVHT